MEPPIDEYDELRAAPARYVMISGHEVEGAFVIAQEERVCTRREAVERAGAHEALSID